MSAVNKQYESYRFPGQKEHEHIMHLVRKHWVIDLKIGALYLLFGVLPLIVMVVGAIFLWDGSFSDTNIAIMITVLVYSLFVMMWTYTQWLNEELDLIIITNERVIAHDQIDLFHRAVSETTLAQIQDTKGVEKGMWGSIFGYGNLDIQTAADRIIFNIQNVKDPYESARYILDLRDQYVDKEKFEPHPDAR